MQKKGLSVQEKVVKLKSDFITATRENVAASCLNFAESVCTELRISVVTETNLSEEKMPREEAAYVGLFYKNKLRGFLPLIYFYTCYFWTG